MLVAGEGRGGGDGRSCSPLHSSPVALVIPPQSQQHLTHLLTHGEEVRLSEVDGVSSKGRGVDNAYMWACTCIYTDDEYIHVHILVN